jgi:hypothetical protein
LSLVREQAFGPDRFPVLSDVVDGEACIGEVIQGRAPGLYPHFDVLLLGYKDSDVNESLGGSGFCPADGWTLGRARVYAPLRHLSDEEVWAAIRELGVPYDEDRYDRGGPDPDEVRACSKCLQAGEGEVFCPKEGKPIPRVGWDKQASLAAFRQRLGMKEAA